VSDEEHPGYELARQVVLNVGAGLAGGYAGPLAGAAAAGAVPVVLAGMDYVSATIGSRRIRHATQVVTDGADDYGAKSPEEFVEFLRAAVSDEDHQELLARVLTIAQDTALRDKRRALGRCLAQAARDTGTKVDPEMLFIRVLADLDEPHIKVLRIMRDSPPAQDRVNQQLQAIGQVARQWHASDIIGQDPGLADVIYGVLPVLARHLLISGGYEMITQAGREQEYTITGYGEFFLDRLADPKVD
jgi:hypothetical protein